MKRLFPISALFLISIISLGLFLACDMEGDTPLRGFYFTIDQTEFNDEYEYYFIGYNTNGAGDDAQLYKGMETETPGEFFTGELYNQGEWVWSIYEVSKEYPNLLEIINENKDILIPLVARGKELPQKYGLIRCEINIPIKLTKDENARHHIGLKNRDTVLTTNIIIEGNPKLGETLLADTSAGNYAFLQYQWMVSDTEDEEYKILSGYTKESLKLDEDFFSSVGKAGISSEDAVFIRVDARNTSGETEAQSAPVVVNGLNALVAVNGLYLSPSDDSVYFDMEGNAVDQAGAAISFDGKDTLTLNNYSGGPIYLLKNDENFILKIQLRGENTVAGGVEGISYETEIYPHPYKSGAFAISGTNRDTDILNINHGYLMPRSNFLTVEAATINIVNGMINCSGASKFTDSIIEVINDTKGFYQCINGYNLTFENCVLSIELEKEPPSHTYTTNFGINMTGNLFVTDSSLDIFVKNNISNIGIQRQNKEMEMRVDNSSISIKTEGGTQNRALFPREGYGEHGHTITINGKELADYPQTDSFDSTPEQ